MARLLSRGTTGVDVSELQAGLNFHVRSPAKPLNPDGIFGPLTEARVREFQKLAALKVDGLVGPNTIAALYRQIRGVVDAKITPREAAVPSSRSLAGVGVGGGTLFGQAAPTDPDVIRPQSRSASSRASSWKASSSSIRWPSPAKVITPSSLRFRSRSPGLSSCRNR